MDFHELAASLLIRFNRTINSYDVKIGYIGIKGYSAKEKAAASYLVRMHLISKPDFIGIKPTNGEAISVNERCEEIVERFDSDVGRIAEHLRKLEGLDNQPIDQSINIANNTGAVVAHSRLDDSPIFINSSVTEQLTKIGQALKEDTSLTNGERQDALFDVETLKSQLRRSKPDTTLLDRILSRLGDIASIGSLIAALSGML